MIQSIQNKYTVINKTSSILLVFFYIILSFYFSNNVEYIGDTLIYKDIYYLSTNTYSYYGMEFIVPTIMFLFREIKISFNGYLFFSLLIWLPIFYSGSKNITKNKLYPLALCFFLLTPYFYLNALFLIRQYYAACFFLIGLCFSEKNKKLFVLFCLLSVFSHSSALLWILFSSTPFIKTITNKIISIFLIFAALLSITSFNFLPTLIDNVIYLGNILGNDNISRKILFYSSGEYLLAQRLPLHFLIYSILCFIFSLLSLRLKSMTHIETKICSLIIMQSFFMIFFKDNIVLANRIGFFVYFFSIPCLLFLIMMLTRPLKK